MPATKPSMTTMKAVDIRGGTGEAEALFINGDTPVPTVGPGRALVRVRAFGLNRMDILQRRGQYPVPPQAPATLGVEFSGVVVEIGGPSGSGSGSGSGDDGDGDGDDDRHRRHDFRPGDEVFGLAYGGAYAEYISVSAKMLLRKPAGLTHEQCAAIPEAWITATQALHLVLGFERGRSILWHAAASGVSVAGIQLSRLAGASAVYATAGSDEKCRFVTEEMGATAAVNYKSRGGVWAPAVAELAASHGGVDYIVDFVGGSYFQQNLDVAARDARIVLLGFMGGAQIPDVDIAPILLKRIRIEGSTLRSRDEDYQGRLRDRLEGYLPAFESGDLSVVVDSVFPWDRIQDAHRYMEANSNSGKIVCTVP